jgi:hypothetical protein
MTHHLDELMRLSDAVANAAEDLGHATMREHGVDIKEAAARLDVRMTALRTAIAKALDEARGAWQPISTAPKAQLGQKLFAFRSKQDWINKAQRIWRLHGVRSDDTCCVDQRGRICTIGLHFMAAERDGAYPIEVFMKRPDMPPPNEEAPTQPATAGKEQ